MMFWALVIVVTVCLWHQSFVTNGSILLRCHNQVSQTTQIPWPFPDFVFSLTWAEFPDIPGFQKSGNPDYMKFTSIIVKNFTV